MTNWMRTDSGDRTVAPSGGDRLKRRPGALRSVLAIVGGNATGTILGAVGGLLAARFVDPTTLGSFRSFTIPLMYLTFLHLGTFDGLNRQIPFYLGQERNDLVEAAAGAAGGWNLLLSALGSLGFLLMAGWSAFHGDVNGSLGWASQAVVAWSVFYGGFLGATYRTIDHFVALARVQTLQSILSLLSTFTLPWLGFLGLCVRSAFPSLAGTWLLHRGRPRLSAPNLRWRALSDLIRVGLPYCFWGSIYTSLWSALESTLMLSLGGPKGLGLFAVAMMLREGVCIVPLAIQQVLRPRLIQAYGREGRLGSAHALAYRIVPPLAVGMAGVVLALSYALDILVPMVIPKYTEGLTLIKVSLWMGVVQAVALPLNALFASEKSWPYGRGILAGVLAFPTVAWLLAPFTGGVLAVAGGSLAGKAVRTALGYLELSLMSKREAR